VTSFLLCRVPPAEQGGATAVQKQQTAEPNPQ
jgi:hypothetical protein